jgi:hypothetical protein
VKNINYLLSRIRSGGPAAVGLHPVALTLKIGGLLLGPDRRRAQPNSQYTESTTAA